LLDSHNQNVHGSYPSSAYAGDAVAFTRKALFADVTADSKANGPCAFFVTSKDASGRILSVADSQARANRPFSIDKEGYVDYFAADLSAGPSTYRWDIAVGGIIVSSGTGDVTANGKASATIQVKAVLPPGLTGTYPVLVRTYNTNQIVCSITGTIDIPGSPVGKPIWVAAVAVGLLSLAIILLLVLL